jgi:uncharacterized membrane protein
VSENKIVVVGGSLEKTLKGETQLAFKPLLEEAWKITAYTKGVMLQSVLLIFCLAMVLVIIGLRIFAVEDLQNIPTDVGLFLDMTLTGLTAPLITAVMMMGINHSIGVKSKPGMLFNYLAKGVWLAITALMVSVFIHLGLTLVLPGIYLGLACSFALPLLVEKKLRPAQAILTSIRAFNKCWLVLSLFYFMFAVLFVASIFTFFFPLIWVIPLYYNMKGILYREIFGINVSVKQLDSSDTKDELVFHA